MKRVIFSTALVWVRKSYFQNVQPKGIKSSNDLVPKS